MEKYVFLKKKEHFDGKIQVVSEDMIEYTPLNEIYDEYGQQTGHSNAGSVLYLLTERAVSLANQWAEQNGEEVTYEVGDAILAYEETLLFDHLTEELDSGDIEIDVESVMCINYHDGRNFRSIPIEGEHAEYTEIDDEKEIEFLNTVLEEKVFLSQGFGTKRFRSGNHAVSQSAFPQDWELYEIELDAY